MPGIAILLRAGVVGWMQTCRSVAGSVLTARMDGEPVRTLPDAVRVEVAVLLAQMALAAAGEMAT
jgi:hypothetical protein